MSGTDDLTPLLLPPGGNSLGFRQGLVVSWDVATGENRVIVGGATLVDLPILNTSDAATLVPGSVVGLLTFGSQMFVLGRVTVPGSADAGTALAAGRMVAAYDTSAYAPPTTGYDGDSPTLDVIVGKSGLLLVQIGCQIDSEVLGATAGGVGGGMSFELSGANVMAASNETSMAIAEAWGAPAPGLNWHTIWRSSYVHLVTGLNPGATTVTAKYKRTFASAVASMADRTLIVTPI